MSTSVKDVFYKAECPVLFDSLLGILTEAMTTSPARNLNDVQIWIDRAKGYMMSLEEARKDGMISNFVAKRFLKDIENIFGRVYLASDRTKWTHEQSGFTFAMSNFRSAFEVK